jgi:SAM-dependent methyltransferase
VWQAARPAVQSINEQQRRKKWVTYGADSHFPPEANTRMTDLAAGCMMPFEAWMELNRNEVFRDPSLRRYVSPFPPPELMSNVSGLTKDQDFAAHGTDIYRALTLASAKPLTDYSAILDFGCGCGRLDRMFKGHPHRIAACDIDARHVRWVQEHLPFVDARVSQVTPPIPFADDEFEAVISISIFTHLTERSQDQFLAELFRVCRPGGRLFLTVHGQRAFQRAIEEPPIRAMMDMDEARFQRARQAVAENRHAFVLQFGHLTTITEDGTRLSGKQVDEPFEYGITFVPEGYLREHWGRWFEVVDYRHGAIHDFQDIVVLAPKK